MSQTEGTVVAGISSLQPNLNGPVIDWAADEAAARGLPLRIIHAQEWPRGTSPRAGPEHPAHVWSNHFRAGGEAALDAAHRDALRDRCAALLPEAPFTVTASAWTVRARA